jgi:hypothetical protein
MSNPVAAKRLYGMSSMPYTLARHIPERSEWYMVIYGHGPGYLINFKPVGKYREERKI